MFYRGPSCNDNLLSRFFAVEDSSQSLWNRSSPLRLRNSANSLLSPLEEPGAVLDVVGVRFQQKFSRQFAERDRQPSVGDVQGCNRVVVLVARITVEHQDGTSWQGDLYRRRLAIGPAQGEHRRGVQIQRHQPLAPDPKIVEMWIDRGTATRTAMVNKELVTWSKCKQNTHQYSR